MYIKIKITIPKQLSLRTESEKKLEETCILEIWIDYFSFHNYMFWIFFFL